MDGEPVIEGKARMAAGQVAGGRVLEAALRVVIVFQAAAGAMEARLARPVGEERG